MAQIYLHGQNRQLNRRWFETSSGTLHDFVYEKHKLVTHVGV